MSGGRRRLARDQLPADRNALPGYFFPRFVIPGKFRPVKAGSAILPSCGCISIRRLITDSSRLKISLDRVAKAGFATGDAFWLKAFKTMAARAATAPKGGEPRPLAPQRIKPAGRFRTGFIKALGTALFKGFWWAFV